MDEEQQKNPSIYVVRERVTDQRERRVNFGDLRSAIWYYCRSKYNKDFLHVSEDGSEVEWPAKKVYKLRDKFDV